jgi:CHAT domain-containing protein
MQTSRSGSDWRSLPLFTRELWDPPDYFKATLPSDFRRPRTATNLSEDLQIYLRCESCLREYRLNPSLVTDADIPVEPQGSHLKVAPRSQCRVDGTQLLAVKHVNVEVRMCLDCKSLKGYADRECLNCGSRNIASIGAYVEPPFPEVFGQATLPALNHKWGIDADTDKSVIRREAKGCVFLPEATLHQIPLAMLADRLSRRNYAEGNTIELRNLAATLLRSTYQQTGNISAGVAALRNFLECVEATESVLGPAVYEYNAATAALSLLAKQQPLVLAVTDGGNGLRELGLQLGDDSLQHFAELTRESDEDSPRVHWLMGDLYRAGLVLGEISDEDLRRARFHYDAALVHSTYMSEADLAHVRQRREEVFSVYSKRHGHQPSSTESTADAVLDTIDWRQHSGDNYLLLLERARSLRLSNPDRAFEMYEAAEAVISERLSAISDASTLASMANLFVSINEELIQTAGERKQGMKALTAIEAVRGVAVRAGSSSDAQRDLQNHEANNRQLQFLLSGGSGTLEDAVERGNHILRKIEDQLRRSPRSLIPKDRAFVAISISHGFVTTVLAEIGGWPRRLRPTVYQWAVPVGTFDVIVERHQLYDETAGPFRERRLAQLLEAVSSLLATKLAPILRQQSAEGIMISAPGWLSHIPYEALRASEEATSVLADSFEVSYLPSLLLGRRLLELGNVGATEDPRLLVVSYGGDDLPESTREVETLRRQWGRSVTVLFAQGCDKLDVLEELNKPYSHVHFACHGTFDPFFPLRSALLLRNVGDEDRYKITASEILQVKMPAAPVVSLSACSSGLTAYGRTNDLTGLTGSFLQAGAKAVVGSRWPVYDDTAASFMTHYYSLILEGKTSLQAVHESQQDLRQKGGRLEDWAAFGYLGICERE